MMNSTCVYRRTPKGEREISLRSLPHEPWLVLVMVDGKSSVDDLVSLKPQLPDLPRSLDRLLREGYIEAIAQRPTPIANQSATSSTPWAPDDGSAGIDFAGLVATWTRRILILLPFLAVVVVLFLVHQSLECLTSQIEESLAKSARHVSIGSSSIVFTPRPALKLTDLAVGESLRVREVVAQPGWSTLFGRPGSITLLELREARLSAEELLALLQSSATALTADGIRIERMTFAASRLDLNGIVLAPLSGDVRYAPDGTLERANLSLDEGRAQASVVGSAVELSASNWSTPTVPSVTLERFDATGNLGGNRLALDRVEALLHDGLVKGDLVLDWTAGLLAEGRFSAANLDVQTLIGSFTQDIALGGRLDADGSFSARAVSAAALLENLSVGVDFRVKRGVLYNTDLSAAAVGNVHGGATQFEELTGNLQTAGRSLSFRRLQLGSGLLTAKGNLDVTPSRQIMGSFSVRLKSQGSSAATISVGGSLTQPRLQLDG